MKRKIISRIKKAGGININYKFFYGDQGACIFTAEFTIGSKFLRWDDGYYPLEDGGREGVIKSLEQFLLQKQVQKVVR